MTKEMDEISIEWTPQHCVLCNGTLELMVEPKKLECYSCKEENVTLVCCPKGHYVCTHCNDVYEEIHNNQEFTLERFVEFCATHKRSKIIGGGIFGEEGKPLLLNYPTTVNEEIKKTLSAELEKTKSYVKEKAAHKG